SFRSVAVLDVAAKHACGRRPRARLVALLDVGALSSRLAAIVVQHPGWFTERVQSRTNNPRSQ
ncbi:MAG: hypothetical protein ACLQBJ_14595, partial [Bryobacteraceae bacterium]